MVFISILRAFATNIDMIHTICITFSEYTWSTWKYVYHYFNGIVKAQMTAFNKYEEGKNDDMDTKGCLDSNKQHNGKLIIHAAVYGLADVTNIVRGSNH